MLNVQAIKKVSAVLCAGVILAVAFLVPSVSAQTYSTEYPQIYNSGSPLWIDCEIDGMGRYLIVIDPNTNPQSFGFDSPTGYNLINNTGTAIYGRAYNVNSDQGFSACWYSYYTLSLKTGYSSNGQQNVYEPYNITTIYGTTLDLIDYVSDRGNDDPQYTLADQSLIMLVVLLVVILFTYAVLSMRCA